MKKVAALVVLLTLAPSAALPQAGTVTFRGAGTSGCGEWVESRKTGTAGTMSAVNMEGWVMGFLSAAADASGKDFLKDADAPSIFLWMDNYCRANPLKKVLHGTQDLFYELGKFPKK